MGCKGSKVTDGKDVVRVNRNKIAATTEKTSVHSVDLSVNTAETSSLKEKVPLTPTPPKELEVPQKEVEIESHSVLGINTYEDTGTLTSEKADIPKGPSSDFQMVSGKRWDRPKAAKGTRKDSNKTKELMVPKKDVDSVLGNHNGGDTEILTSEKADNPKSPSSDFPMVSGKRWDRPKAAKGTRKNTNKTKEVGVPKKDVKRDSDSAFGIYPCEKTESVTSEKAGMPTTSSSTLGIPMKAKTESVVDTTSEFHNFLPIKDVDSDSLLGIKTYEDEGLSSEEDDMPKCFISRLPLINGKRWRRPKAAKGTRENSKSLKKAAKTEHDVDSYSVLGIQNEDLESLTSDEDVTTSSSTTLPMVSGKRWNRPKAAKGTRNTVTDLKKAKTESDVDATPVLSAPIETPIILSDNNNKQVEFHRMFQRDRGSEGMPDVG